MKSLSLVCLIISIAAYAAAIFLGPEYKGILIPCALMSLTAGILCYTLR